MNGPTSSGKLDIGYEHEPGYPRNLFTASVNADNFANLVRDLA